MPQHLARCQVGHQFLPVAPGGQPIDEPTEKPAKQRADNAAHQPAQREARERHQHEQAPAPRFFLFRQGSGQKQCDASQEGGPGHKAQQGGALCRADKDTGKATGGGHNRHVEGGRGWLHGGQCSHGLSLPA